MSLQYYLYKSSNDIFHRNRTNNYQICLIHKRPPNLKSISSRNSKAGGITLPNFKPNYKSVVIKTVWCWYKNTLRDQCNRAESLETNHIRSVIFDRRAKNMQWRNESLFNKCWEYWISTCKKWTVLYHTLKLAQNRLGTRP